MLQWMDLTFRVRPVDIDETPLSGEAPEPYVCRLAETKALAARGLAEGDTFILAADTIVADGDTLLGKPSGPDEAREMLRTLRGRVHRVCTALAVIPPGAENALLDLCVSQVPMRDYSDAEIEAYIASGDPLDKAGAYGIQHYGALLVEGVFGDYFNVMGLPVNRLRSMLARFGVDCMGLIAGYGRGDNS